MADTAVADKEQKALAFLTGQPADSDTYASPFGIADTDNLIREINRVDPESRVGGPTDAQEAQTPESKALAFLTSPQDDKQQKAMAFLTSPDKQQKAMDFLTAKPGPSLADRAMSFLTKTVDPRPLLGSINDAVTEASDKISLPFDQMLAQEIPAMVAVNKAVDRVAGPINKAVQGGAEYVAENTGELVSKLPFPERVQAALRDVAVQQVAPIAVAAEAGKELTKLPYTMGGMLGAIATFKFSEIGSYYMNKPGAVAAAGDVLAAMATKKADGVPFELVFATDAPTPLIDKIRSVVGLVKRAQDQGVHPATIMTDEERAILAKFSPMIKSAVEFRVPVQTLISGEELTSYEQAVAATRQAIGQTIPAAESRIAAMEPAEQARNATELAAASSGKDAIVRPIQSTDDIIERQAREILPSETEVLGVQKNSPGVLDIANKAVIAMREGRPITREARQQVADAVVEAIKSGEISDPLVIAKMYGIPHLETTENRIAAANVVREVLSEAGRTLNAASQIGRQMEVILSRDPAAASWLKNMRSSKMLPWDEAPWNPVRSFLDKYASLDRFRLAAMTSSIFTTIRNVQSQGERSLAAAFEHAVSGAIGAASGKTGWRNALDASYNDMAGLIRAWKPSTRAAIDDLLAKFPLESNRLLNTPIGDRAVDRGIGALINTGNIVQEQYFRRAAFDAWSRTSVARDGRTLAQITDGEVKQAVEYALHMTYAQTPLNYEQADRVVKKAITQAVYDYATQKGVPIKDLTAAELEAVAKRSRIETSALYGVGNMKGIFNNAGSGLLNLYRQVPVLTMAGNPFPRFAINALGRLYDMSPMALFDQATYQAMSHPDPRIAYQAISRSITGGLYVAAGAGLAAAGMWGDKWYEFNPSGLPASDKSGKRRLYDFRPYNPVIAPMAIGRIMWDIWSAKDAQERKWALLNLTPEDLVQMTLSMKRTDFTGVPILDLISTSANQSANALNNMLSSYASSFEPRLLTSDVKEALGLFDKGARLPRSYTEGPIKNYPIDTGVTRAAKNLGNAVYGSSLANVPFASASLPVRPSPLRAGPEERENKFQNFAFSSRIKTPVEAEADRLGIRPRAVYPHTGQPTYDRLIEEAMGPILAGALERLRLNKAYLAMDNSEKKKLYETVINGIQTAAKFKAAGKDFKPASGPPYTFGERRGMLIEYYGRNKADKIQDTLNLEAYKQAYGQYLEDNGVPQ